MQDNVGTIVIGTKVNNNGLKSGLKETENIVKNFDETNEMTPEIDIDEDQLDKIGQKIKDFAEENDIPLDVDEEDGIQAINTLIEKAKEVELQKIEIEPSINMQELRLQKAELWQEMIDVFNQINEEANINPNMDDTDLIKYLIKLEEILGKMDELDIKMEDFANTGLSGALQNIGKIEKGLGSLVKKAGKLALSLVGVQTIISVITRSFNTLTEYNTELGIKVEQMGLVLAVALEPVINWIINALQVVLSLVDKIYSALFGISLYGRANELWSKKMAKNMSSGAGSAKEMRKQLAGFDEMNVLNDNVAGSGGGGFDDYEPFDLPDVPIPKGLQWIMDNAEPLGAIMGGVAGGAMLMADGLFRLNIALQEYEKSPSLENFGEIAHRAGESITGFGMLTMDMPTVIGGSFIAIAGILTNHKEEVDKMIDDTVKTIDTKSKWIDDNVSKTLGHMFKNLGSDIDFIRKDFWKLMEEAKNDFDSIGRVIQKFKEGDIKGAWNEITNWLSAKWNQELSRFNGYVSQIKNNIVNLYNGIKNDTINAVNFVINQFSRIASSMYNMGIAIGDFIGGAVRGAVNGALSFVEGRINNFISMINNVISIINKIPGVSIGRIGYISLPRMAVGGIVNQPGRGVPVGGAIAGESGREGILPLTDKQAMAELGREIGKWISIQATVPVNIGNRQVARVIQELNNDREFAMNS